ncbi:hypothetical protein TraAM80_00313 [Trypanosoma rangeli]|uniref:Uncharacterized protein n=1 Tax=Trypanosoma rangeli TaxID=5698 RepID=A0A3R7RTA5_TRYRA|nr:uncharacterized protein TraAM80_00313 [Trypanosoma rangeli]RNF12461.1 hypothetical protein TraAM80_00313 [Trypanosoma rangeli]|eukprot:RNF12461.1 hypothetical protein TraAM80_00313 [Trypanosoma rangeli]
MEPVISPLPRNESSFALRRADFDRTRRLHAGTLNIFLAEEPATVAATTPHAVRRSHHNDESNETREFMWGRLRRVEPPQHTETPQGIHHVERAAGKRQNIQVVGITETYKNPKNLPPARSGVRCRVRSNSSLMHDVMSHAGDGVTQSGSRRPQLRVVNYSRQERFSQAVRDHVQRRRGGITAFYVNLARGLVGRVATETPVSPPREWHLEDLPPTHTLTLDSCRDQLQSLTGITVSPEELAEILWGAKENIASSGGGDPSEKERGQMTVTYRDFSGAFGDNAENNKLLSLKI